MPIRRIALWFVHCLLLGSLATLPAPAQDDQSATLQGLKIGFVSSLQVLYGAEEGKLEIGRVQQFMDEKQKEYDERRLELERLREQFQAQQRTLNPQTLAEMQRTIEDKDRRLRRFQEDTQLEINRRRDEIFDKMSDKIQAVINEYAGKNSYSAIFLRDDSQIYVAPALDLTDEIIKIYNERNPAAGPQTTSNAPSAPSNP